MGFLFSFIPWPNAEILQELAGGQAGEKKERGWFCQQIQLRKVQIFIYGFSEGQFCFAFSEKKNLSLFTFFLCCSRLIPFVPAQVCRVLCREFIIFCSSYFSCYSGKPFLL